MEWFQDQVTTTCITYGRTVEGGSTTMVGVEDTTHLDTILTCTKTGR
jgi:hypothetical protein